MIAQNQTGVIDGTSSQESLIVALFSALTADAPTETTFADTIPDSTVADSVEAADMLGDVTNAAGEAISIEDLATALGVDEQTVAIITAALDFAAGNTTEGIEIDLLLNETALKKVNRMTRKIDFGAFKLRPFQSKDELWAYI